MWTTFANFVKHRSMRLLEILCARPLLTPSDVDMDSIHRILVIRQHDQLGDFLISTPVLRALRDRFPNSNITLITRSYTTDVARYNKYINNVISLHDSGYNYSWKWLRTFWKKLRSGYDLTIVLNTVSHSLSSDLLAHFSRARYILGTDAKVFAGCRRNFFYHLEAPVAQGLKHQTHRNLDIVRYLGIDTNDLSENMSVTDDEIHWAKNWLTTNNPDDEILLGIHPGAGKLENRWPVDRIAAVANHFYQKYGIHWLITWGPNESDVGEALKAELAFAPIVLTDITLRQFAAVVSQLPFFLCNDTGVMHVAAAIGTPLLGIFGPTDISQWKPLGDNFQAIQGSDKTVMSVSVEDVIERIDEQLVRRGIINSES